MPKAWYDRSANKLSEEPTEDEIRKREFNLRILADKKPYFMRYIYPELMRDYNTYMRNADVKCLREFRISLADLQALDADKLTDDQRDFLRYYHMRMPVGMHDCVVNRICRRFEQEFDHYFLKMGDAEFDYTVMKSGMDYGRSQYEAVRKLYDEHLRTMQDFSKFVRAEGVDEDAAQVSRVVMVDRFRARCVEICTDARQLCDILLDVCYRREGSRQFVWDICSHEIMENLFARNGGVLSYPEMDDAGDIEFNGKRFSMKTIGGFGDEQHYSEREDVCAAGDGEQEPGEQSRTDLDACCEAASC